MANNRYTLLIDGNYFLFRTLFVNPSSRSGELLADENSIAVFVRKLATDLTYQIRLFDGLIGNIVWAQDSKSWRKPFHPELDYKGSRKKNNKVNWDNFQKASESFTKILAEYGVSISKAAGAEGDDLVWAWSERLINDGTSSIIFSGDRDLMQLIQRSGDNHILFYSPTHKNLSVPIGFNNWISHKEDDEGVDIFNMSSISENQTKQKLESVIKKKKIDPSELNVEIFKLNKVLTGDAGDNVPPVYTKIVAGKDGKERKYGVSDKKASKICIEYAKKYNDLSISNLLTDDACTYMANTIIKNLNIQDKTQEDIIESIKLNCKLMILSTDLVPSEVLEAMEDDISNNINNKTDLSKFKNMKSLLANSDFVTKDLEMAQSSSFLKDAGDSDMSFITDAKQNQSLF